MKLPKKKEEAVEEEIYMRAEELHSRHVSERIGSQISSLRARQMELLCWFHPHAVTCICPMASGLQAR